MSRWLRNSNLHAKATFGVLNGTAKETSAVVCGPEQASTRIANLSPGVCGCQEQPCGDLREVSLGLWEGLPNRTWPSDIRMHRQWRANPTSVLTPGGSWNAAARRVMGELLDVAARKEDVRIRGPCCRAG